MRPLPVDCRDGHNVTITYHVSIFANFCLDFGSRRVMRCRGNSFSATAPVIRSLVIEQLEQTDLFLFVVSSRNTGKRHRALVGRAVSDDPLFFSWETNNIQMCNLDKLFDFVTLDVVGRDKYSLELSPCTINNITSAAFLASPYSRDWWLQRPYERS